jgi:predicted  nucleic acid-binding Zn-ribbon protein
VGPPKFFSCWFVCQCLGGLCKQKNVAEWKGLGMNEYPFQSFIDLIAIDQAIMTSQNDLAKVSREIDLLTNQERSLVRQLEQASKEVHDAQKDVDAKELDMKVLDAQAQERKKQLDTLENYKEYDSIKHEIDQIKKQQHNLEVVLMTVWNKLEISKKELDTKKKQIDETLHTVRTAIAEKEQLIAALNMQIAEKNKVRPEKEHNVPAEWLEKYAIMRAQVEDPVVSVVQGSCNACFYPVTEQDLLLLKRHKLLQCKGCYRFLYLESTVGTANTSQEQ